MFAVEDHVIFILANGEIYLDDILKNKTGIVAAISFDYDSFIVINRTY